MNPSAKAEKRLETIQAYMVANPDKAKPLAQDNVATAMPPVQATKPEVSKPDLPRIVL